jgi:hypothetical protein
MLQGWTNRYGPTTAERVAGFEAQLGHTLPDDYRRFLLECNGGAPEGQVFVLGSLVLPELLGLRAELGKSVEFDDVNPEDLWELDLEEAQRLYWKEGWGSGELIVIGWERFGGCFCLGIEGGYRGKVYFLDPYQKAKKGDPEAKKGDPAFWWRRRMLAASFTEFLAGLRPLDRDSVS